MITLRDKRRANDKWFYENKKILQEMPKYKDKYLVIYQRAILASFKSEHHAVEFVENRFKGYDNQNECIIKKVEDPDEELTVYVDVE